MVGVMTNLKRVLKKKKIGHIWLPVTSPQKLRHMVTSPHFEKVREIWG